MNRPTSTQPQVDNVPIGIYSSKNLSTVRVTVKGDKAKDVIVINAEDFDESKHVRVD